MRKDPKSPLLLLILLLIPFAVIGLMSSTVAPAYATPDPGWLHSHPTAHVEIGGLIGNVNNPTWAYNKDNATYADFLYGTKPAGSFNLTTFETPIKNYTIEGDISFKMRYHATASDNEPYRIVYYVDPSPTATVLVDWNLAGAPLATYVWPSQPEPNDGSWNWTDINNIRFVVEVGVVVGGADKAPFLLYEAWVSVPVGPEPTPTLYMEPPSTLGVSPGGNFYIEMAVKDVEDLWGYTFVCSYNTTVLTATSYTTYSPYTLPWPSEINDTIATVTGEDVGTGNGVATVFYLARLTVVGGSETVYLGGVPQTRDVDYTIVYETGEITFTTPPATGVAITADYQQNAYVAVSYSKGFADPGEDTGIPDFSIFVCRVDFTVDGPGWSKLYLWFTDLSDSDGVPIYHLHVGGYFSTTAIHDIAVTDVTPTPTSVLVGDNVTITVDVENQGDFPETFNVTTYYDSTPIWPEPEMAVSLEPRENIMLTFTWNTTGVPESTYTMKAAADVVAGETDTADNEFINGSVTVGAAVPEFPLGMAMELALVVAVVYVWWKRTVKVKTSKFTT